jgi:hypothetical protein
MNSLLYNAKGKRDSLAVTALVRADFRQYRINSCKAYHDAKLMRPLDAAAASLVKREPP